jgi:hypothetical protein
MIKSHFYDELTLANAATELGEQAMKLRLIPSFVVRHFPDSRQFYIPNESASEALTPEQAYLKLKRLVEQAEQSV